MKADKVMFNVGLVGNMMAPCCALSAVFCLMYVTMFEARSDVFVHPFSYRLVPSPSRSDPMYQGHQSERGVDFRGFHGHHHR